MKTERDVLFVLLHRLRQQRLRLWSVVAVIPVRPAERDRLLHLLLTFLGLLRAHDNLRVASVRLVLLLLLAPILFRWKPHGEHLFLGGFLVVFFPLSIHRGGEVRGGVSVG